MLAPCWRELARACPSTRMLATQLPSLAGRNATGAQQRNKRPQLWRPSQTQVTEGYRQRVSRELEVREQSGDAQAFLGDAPDFMRVHGSTSPPPRGECGLRTMFIDEAHSRSVADCLTDQTAHQAADERKARIRSLQQLLRLERAELRKMQQTVAATLGGEEHATRAMRQRARVTVAPAGLPSPNRSPHRARHGLRKALPTGWFETFDEARDEVLYVHAESNLTSRVRPR